MDDVNTSATFLHEELISGSVTFLVQAIRLGDCVNIRDAANAVASAVGAHSQKEVTSVEESTGRPPVVMCPRALLNVLPQLFEYVTHAHGLVADESRAAEHAVTNLLLKMILLSSSRQAQMKEALSDNLLFMLNAAFVQLRVLEHYPHQFSFSGVPSVTVIPSQSPFTSLFDDYIWLAVFSLLQLGPEGLKNKFDELSRPKRAMDDVFIHHLLYMTVKLLGYYCARLLDAHASFGLQSANVADLLKKQTNAFPLDVLQIFESKKPRAKEARRNFTVPSEFMAVVERITATSVAVFSLVDNVELVPGIVEPVEAVRASLTWLCSVVAFCTMEVAADESQGAICRRALETCIRVNTAASPLLRIAVLEISSSQGSHQISAEIVESLAYRMVVSSFVLISAWAIHRAQALDLVSSSPASTAADVVVVHSPEQLCCDMLQFAARLVEASGSASAGSRSELKFATIVARAADELTHFAAVGEDRFHTIDHTTAFASVAQLFTQFAADVQKGLNMSHGSQHWPTLGTELQLAAHLLSTLSTAATAEHSHDVSAHDAWWQACAQYWKLFSGVEGGSRALHSPGPDRSGTKGVVVPQTSASVFTTNDLAALVGAAAPAWDNLESWESARRLQNGHPAGVLAVPPLLNAAARCLNKTLRCGLEVKGGLVKSASYCKVFAQLLLMNDGAPVEIAVELLRGASAMLAAAVDQKYPEAVNERLLVEALTSRVIAARLKVFPVCDVSEGVVV